MISDESVTLYDILDITPAASPQEVREAYIRTKSTYNKDGIALYTLITPEEREETLKKIEEAYLVLSNPEKRRDYDANYERLNSSENPFAAKIVSIDRVPPMENHPDGDSLLIPPTTHFPSPEENPTQESTDSRPAPPPFKTPDSRIELPPKNISQPLKTAPSNRSRLPEIDSSLVHAIEAEVEWNGSFLRKIRDAYQISIEEMAGITKVTKTYLLAVEEENYERLPAAVYIRGFVTQIAKVLKLPHEKVASAYLSRYHRKRTE